MRYVAHGGIGIPKLVNLFVLGGDHTHLLKDRVFSV